jgi:hypothetical protein
VLRSCLVTQCHFSFKGEFEITIGLANIYIGLHIIRDQPQHIIYVDQACYIETLLAKCDFPNINPISIPIGNSVYLQ